MRYIVKKKLKLKGQLAKIKSSVDKLLKPYKFKGKMYNKNPSYNTRPAVTIQPRVNK